MPNDRDADRGGVLAFLLPVAAVAICCAGPILLGLIASAGISGAVVAGLLPAVGLAFVAVLLVVGVAWMVRRRGAGADCCVVPPTAATSKERSGGLPR